MSQPTIYPSLSYNTTYGYSTNTNTIHTTTVSTQTAGKLGWQPVSRNVVYGIFILNGILSLLGLLGNIFVCLIIIRGRKMYTIANLFLMNLAIADICVIVVSYPLWVIQSLTPLQWPFGSALCKIIPTVSDAFYGVSLGCMTTISIHRYRMILHAMESQLTFFQAKIIIIVVWLISLASISVPLYPVLQYFERTSVRNITTSTNMTLNVTHTDKFCRSIWPDWTYERAYQIFLAIAWYILPLAIIFISFLRIKYYLQKQMAYEWLKGSEHNVLIANHILGIRKALRMLAPVVIVFALLMLPWNILRILSAFIKLSTIPHLDVYVLVAGTMLVANSVSNPFIYYIMSKEFRVEFRKQVWLLKRALGLGKQDEYTIQSDRDGRRYVRRFHSFADRKRGSRGSNSTYKSHLKSRTLSSEQPNCSKSRTPSNLTTTSYTFSNGATPTDYDEMFKQQSPSLHEDVSYNRNQNLSYDDINPNYLDAHRSEQQLYNISEEMSVDLESKDSGFENEKLHSDKNLNSKDWLNNNNNNNNDDDVFLDVNGQQEEIIKETVL